MSLDVNDIAFQLLKSFARQFALLDGIGELKLFAAMSANLFLKVPQRLSGFRVGAWTKNSLDQE